MSNVNPGLRRLPVYLLLDCSGSMHGEPIESVRQGLHLIQSDLQSNPQAIETVWLSVITFDSTAKQIVPLTPIDQFTAPTIEATGTTSLGRALNMLLDCIDKEVRKTTAEVKGDFKPLVFIMTDGVPTDSWEDAANKVMKRRLGKVIACAAGAGADETNLKKITEDVVKLTNNTPGALGAYFEWVTASISATSSSVAVQGDAPVNLPPPPADQGIVIVP